MSETFGRYTVVRQLGRGAMGVVYLASDPLLNRQVAVKTVELGADVDPAEKDFMRTRLLRDARAAAVLKHPNIVAIYDVFEDGTGAYLVMEYVEGDNLAALLKANPIPYPALILKVLSQMADALDYTHARGVIHRDIKPANVMIDSSSNAKIMDFGIARITDTRTCTPTGMVMGTVEYMAPEQILGATVDGRADQFALAVVAYQMMTGSTLFGPNTLATLTYKIVNEAPPLPSTRNASLPQGVDAVLSKGLAKNPADRFTKCGEFVGALERAFSDAPTAPLAPSVAPVVVAPQASIPVAPTTVVLPPPRPSKAPLIAAAAVVLLLGGALAAVVWKPWHRAPQEPVAAANPAITSPALTSEPPAAPGSEVHKPEAKTATAPIEALPDVMPPTGVPKATPPVATPPTAVSAPPAPVSPPAVAEVVGEPEMIPVPTEPRNGRANPTPYLLAMQRGQEQVKENDYPGALQSFGRAISLRPESGQAHYSRGVAYQHLEQFDAAMKDYTDALRSEPRLVMAYIGMGGCLLKLHRDQEAFLEFQRAIQLRPDAVVALTARGNIYLRRKQYRLALADYDRALAINPNYAPAYPNRAHAREALGDSAGAAADRRTEATLRKQ